MGAFEECHRDRITGSLAMFDRMIFKGHISALYMRDGARCFLWSQGVALKDFAPWVKAVTERVAKTARKVARDAGRPVISFDQVKVRHRTQHKDELAKSIAERDGVTEGVVCLISAVESCFSFEVRKRHDTGRLELVRRDLGRDLGYYDGPGNDHGSALATAVVGRTPPRPLRDVRPGLDVVSAGRETATAEAAIAARRSADPYAAAVLGEVLTPLAGDYDLVLFDCPPATHSPILDAALTAARWLLIPTLRDEASLDGLERMAENVERIRTTGLNPGLELLGVAMVNFPPRGIDTRDVRAELTAALGADLVFTTAIRESANAAAHARKLGVLQYEYEHAAAAQEPWYKHRSKTRRYSRSATGLSADYQALTDEILGRYISRTTAGATT